jgi:hypothetical protein
VNALGGLRDDCGVHAERAEWLQRMRKCGVVAYARARSGAPGEHC